jgi:hypothetical protein
VKENTLSKFLDDDEWAGVAGRHLTIPFNLRYRMAVLTKTQPDGYDQLLKVAWTFVMKNSIAMPEKEDAQRMYAFERSFCKSIKWGCMAILTAVFTFEGTRQWIFYTKDVEECRRRLDQLLSRTPYPLELNSQPDPEWSYLHEHVLKQAPIDTKGLM